LEAVNANLNMIKSVAGNPTVIQYVKGEAGIPYDAVQLYLQDCDAVLNDGQNTAVTDVTGMQVARGTGDFISVAERDYYKAAIAGQVYISNILVSQTTGRRMISFAVPVKDGDTVIGIVHRNYDLSNLHDILAAEAENAFVVDRDGMVAAHSQYEIAEGVHDEVDVSTSEFYTSGADSGYYKSASAFGTNYMAYYKEPLSGFVVVTAKSADEIMSSARQSAIIVIIVGIILLAVAIVISFMMEKSFTEPVKAVDKSLEALSDGRFVKVEKFDLRKDEFGAISKATNAVIGKLDDIVSNIKASAEDVGASSTELSDMANQISQTAEDVSNAVQEIATGATQQADEIQSATENVGKIGEAVGDVQDSTGNLSGIASKMKEASEISSQSLASLQDSSAEMTAKIDEISVTIQSTQNAVNNISDKVEGITSIATQTNLLSLNASIEAARAGEAGKGFAVVAENIKQLAESSSENAAKIKDIVNRVTDISNETVSVAERVSESIQTEKGYITDTQDKFEILSSAVDQSITGINSISEMAKELNTIKNELTSATTDLGAISEELGASAQEVAASCATVTEACTDTQARTEEMRAINENLNTAVGFFKL
jgi:methyl-accepting chemotaxis protein